MLRWSDCLMDRKKKQRKVNKHAHWDEVKSASDLPYITRYLNESTNRPDIGSHPPTSQSGSMHCSLSSTSQSGPVYWLTKDSPAGDRLAMIKQTFIRMVCPDTSFLFDDVIWSYLSRKSQIDGNEMITTPWRLNNWKAESRNLSNHKSSWDETSV